jgi:signal transduction histidine kinase
MGTLNSMVTIGPLDALSLPYEFIMNTHRSSSNRAQPAVGSRWPRQHKTHSPKPPLLSRFWQTAWVNRKFRTKIALLLILTAVVPAELVLYVLVGNAEAHLQAKLRSGLQKDMATLQLELEHWHRSHGYLATLLEQQAELAAVDLTPNQPLFDQLLDMDHSGSETRGPETRGANARGATGAPVAPSFYILTDAQGRTVAQRIRAIVPTSAEQLPPGPVATVAPFYRPVERPLGIDLSPWAIVQTALKTGQSQTGTEVVSPTILASLGLADQAKLGLRPQKVDGLPAAKQPTPMGTYPTGQGEVGLVTVAIQPIYIRGQLAGTAIVGTVLNRNPTLVDQVRHRTGIATATLFAYDWRISTNVPNPDGHTRALGTRAAQEVAEAVLGQGMPFVGETNIVGSNYFTAYTPIYDHRHQTQPTTKPIGMLYVGKPTAQIQQVTMDLRLKGYGIGAGVLLGVVLLAFPIANSFTASLRRLTRFAERVGQDDLGFDPVLSKSATLVELQERRDEIGILSRSLDQMATRVTTNLSAVQASEAQVRTQAQDLQQALEELQQAQLQLVQTEKMSSLGQLVAGIAHEINNPVGFIHGNLSPAIAYTDELFALLKLYQQTYPQPSPAIQAAMEEMDLDFVATDLPKLLDSMKIGTTRIREIVLSLRSFSRLDEADMKPVNIHEGLDNTLLILHHRLKPKHGEGGIQVLKHYGDLPPVECYAGQLNQVLMNLLTNAIDALEEMPKDAPETGTDPKITIPKITIQTEAVGGDRIQIRISDNGPGIPDAIKTKLFDPFFTTKPVGKGTGLGLSISHQIIEKHGGTLTCESVVPHGTTFTIQIPMQLVTPIPAVVPPAREPQRPCLVG